MILRRTRRCRRRAARPCPDPSEPVTVAGGLQTVPGGRAAGGAQAMSAQAMSIQAMSIQAMSIEAMSIEAMSAQAMSAQAMSAEAMSAQVVGAGPAGGRCQLGGGERGQLQTVLGSLGSASAQSMSRAA